MVDQLTVFLENRTGHLASLTRAISDSGFNMHALYLADTADFGVARILCDKPAEVKAMLVERGFRAALTAVVAVRLADEPGSLATLLEHCDAKGLNVEYAYCFLGDGDHAIDVLKFDDGAAEETLRAGGFTLVAAEEIYLP